MAVGENTSLAEDPDLDGEIWVINLLDLRPGFSLEGPKPTKYSQT
jgi:hypothetical protein